MADAARRRVACDACGASGWIGPRPAASEPGIVDAWCEGCQTPHPLPIGGDPSPACPRCGVPLTVGEPRFEELPGEARNICALLAAWCGDPGPLADLLPDRPRYLTDLEPPRAREGDSAAARAGLEALARGQLARARDALAEAARAAGSPGHVWRGLGIAAQRLGERPLAEQAFGRAIDADPGDTAARLDRGVLRAERRDFVAARADFVAAGDRPEARWNRAALRVIVAVAYGSGPPDPAALRHAREQAGEPSAYWSDPTVGRLLWALLVERAGSAAGTAPAPADELLAAERELEFDGFLDRAMVVHGYAKLGLRRRAGEVAAEAARRQVERLRAEPFARGPAGGWLAARLAEAATAVAEGRPGDALAAIRGVVDHPDVRRYRVPCHACRRGSLGIESKEAARTQD